MSDITPQKVDAEPALPRNVPVDPFGELKALVGRMLDDRFNKGYLAATNTMLDAMRKFSLEDQQKFAPLMNALEDQLLKK